jgi:hypothetical protein
MMVDSWAWVDVDALREGEGGVMRNLETADAMCAWRGEGGRAVQPKTKPPRAWHAWVRRTSVGASRLDRMEGRRSVKAGTNVAG